METKYNYNLEIKQFLILYLRLIGLVVAIPAIIILIPFIALLDWVWDRFKYNYFGELYRHYIELTNLEINLP